ncbi:MAG: choice-of-anchor D domain-containing protein [Terriglobales bacterium]
MRRVLPSAFLFLGLILNSVVPAFAGKHRDFPNSSNGSNPPNACPADSPTPFLAALNGTVAPNTGSGSGKCSSAPSFSTTGTYPDLSLLLSSTQLGVAVKIVPALFGNGFSSPKTVLNISFGGPPNWTLKSILVRSLQSNPGYVICDPAGVGGASSKANFASGGASFCTDQPLAVVPPLTTAQDNYDIHSVSADEPEPIVFADASTTRWEFTNFASGTNLAILVDNFMYDSSGAIRSFFTNDLGLSPVPADNNLVLVDSNVGVIVTDSSGSDHVLGSLPLSLQPATHTANNDVFTNAHPIVGSASIFADFVDVTGANPTITSGAIWNTQSDPLPSCFDGINFGTQQVPDPDPSQVFRSVWYSYASPGIGILRLSTWGSRYDTRLLALTSSSANFTPVACNDDSSLPLAPAPVATPFSIPQAQTSIVTAPATTYYFMVSEEPPPLGSVLTNNVGSCTPQNSSNCQPYLPATSANALVNQLLPLSRDATLSFSLALTGLQAIPTGFTFGSQMVGTPGAGQQFTFVAANDDISNLSITASGDFQVATNNCPTTLALGQPCGGQVTFTPTATGTRTGSLIASGRAISAGSPVSVVVGMSGTGAGVAAATLSSNSVSFAPTLLGTTATEQTVNLTNSGTATLNIQGESLPAGPFSFTTNCAATLSPNASCSLAIRFKPSATGSASATLSINDSAGNSPQTISVSGTGIDFSVAATPSSLTVAAGQPAGSTVTVQAISGFNGQVTVTCSGLPAGAACVFSPATLNLNGGSATSSLTITTTSRVLAWVPFRDAPLHAPRITLATFAGLFALLRISRSAFSQLGRTHLRVMLTVVAAGLLLLGCGAGSSNNATSTPANTTSTPNPNGTPAGAYTVTVTGTASGQSHTSTLSFTVQ